MTIYLDNCVFQDLKDEKYKSLLELIKEDKVRNLYCFSEAHLYDLSRDKTEHKFMDMIFMEEISENHCFYFDERTRFRYRTPTDYYNSFDWEHSTSFDDIFSESDGVMKMFKPLFKSISLDFKSFIPSDALPVDMPEDFKILIEKPSNLYEFFLAFMEFTDDLTKEQKKFRELVRYLHKNSLTDTIYEAVNIEGYSGGKIVDKEKFRNSYAKYFIKEGQRKTIYDLFLDMYYGLETFGFIKGKPAKQKLINLINDARHAFFGAHCDIVVSSDDDFIRKTKFIYEMNEIRTFVLHINELEPVINNLKKHSELLFIDIVKEFKETDFGQRIIKIDENENSRTICILLQRIYFSYFNMLVHVTTQNGTYQYFTQHSNNYASGVMIKEIEYVTNKLVKELGRDLNGYELFSSNEIIDDKWCGRTWMLSEVILELNFIEKLHLALYPLEYIKKLEKQK